MSAPTTIDARGHLCPVPSLRLQKAMAAVAPGARLVLLATDPMAQIDVPYLISQKGGRIVEIQEADGLLRITVEIGSAPRDAPTD